MYLTIALRVEQLKRNYAARLCWESLVVLKAQPTGLAMV